LIKEKPAAQAGFFIVNDISAIISPDPCCKPAESIMQEPYAGQAY
jgi:hypothetical protein